MLYVVSTPIGNLEDISLRALRVLREADLIACEDTRQTQKLVLAYNLGGRLVSYHRHSAKKKTESILSDLEAGKNIAVVSDGGTPGISDPGYLLVKGAVDKGLPVTVIPGPSAVTGALILSGLPTDGFLFLGFLPRKKGKIKKVLMKSRSAGMTTVFYESPYRVKSSLGILKEVFGEGLPVAVVREMTKKFEEVVRGSVESVIGELSQREIKGEVTVVFSPVD